MTEKPSFCYFSSTPGNEDSALAAVSKLFDGSVPIVGGSVADNDVTGQWLCLASSPCSGMYDEDNSDFKTLTTGNGVAICLAWPSVMVKAALFSGYSPTRHEGVITKTAGKREVVEIDGRPAAEVYKEWAGAGDLAEAFASGESETNVLGPASFYPMGQLYGHDGLGYPYYRILHPHLIKKGTQSFTLFGDVKVGDTLVLMAGTNENLVNRISLVARHIARESSFSANEITGAMVIYCGGCMMAVKRDMRTVAKRLNSALANSPHLVTHTFGEQGQFPDGTSQHGNLMFSCLLFSNRRVVDRIINLDTGVTIEQDDPEYTELVEHGLLKRTA